MLPPHRFRDGTRVFHALGELPVDRDEEKVRCGLCGRWFRALHAHLWQAHGCNADEYRLAFGLNARRPLQAPAVSAAQAAALARRIDTDPRIRAGMRTGLALARSGTLNELGRQADAERGRALERRRQAASQGARMGTHAPHAFARSATAAPARSVIATRTSSLGSATSSTARPSPSWRRRSAAPRSP